MSARFRPVYRELSDEDKAFIGAIKFRAERLEEVIEKTLPSRYKSLALTSLEESVMWAVKGVTT